MRTRTSFRLIPVIAALLVSACAGAPGAVAPTAAPVAQPTTGLVAQPTAEPAPTAAPAPTIAATVQPAAQTGPIVITAAGATPDDIRAKVDEYRGLFGGADNGGEPGSKPTGYRSINWDGLPDELAAPNLYAPDFFNNAKPPRARGA